MDGEWVSRKEFETFKTELEKRTAVEHKRLEDEDDRQNHRLKEVEEQNKQITNLALSVKEVAASVKDVAKETQRLSQMVNDSVKKLDDRLTKIEGRDGERWRSVVGYLITAVLSVAVGLLFSKIGLSM